MGASTGRGGLRRQGASTSQTCLAGCWCHLGRAHTDVRHRLRVQHLGVVWDRLGGGRRLGLLFARLAHEVA